jgi:DNA-binding MarR family transcriptional regulator
MWMPLQRMPTEKRTPQQKRALRFLEVLEAVMAREMRLSRDGLINALDITPPEFRSLIWLYRNGRSVMSAFAEGLDIPLSTATRIVNRLVKKGIAVRHRSDFDRRIVEVDLSPSAYEHAQRFRTKRLATLEQILAPLDPGESETVVALLEKGLQLSGPAEKSLALSQRLTTGK